jgi:hypothetical protein
MAIFKVGQDRPSPDEIREKFFKNKEEKTKLLNQPISRPLEDIPTIPKSKDKVELSNSAKTISQQVTAPTTGATTVTVTVSPAASTEPTKDEKPEVAVDSDIKKNDPNDPVTKEKLKALLSNGGFNFKPEERKALSDILTSKP